MRHYKKNTRSACGFYYSEKTLNELKELSTITKKLNERNVIPATSSNFSVRLCEKNFLITRSGYHKKETTPKHFMRLDIDGNSLSHFSLKPSDESKLHARIYKNFPFVNCVLHCHSNTFDKYKPPFIKFSNHELLKALGFKSHENEFHLSIFENTQDMDFMQEKLKIHFEKNAASYDCAFLLENHGIYVFAKNVPDAFNKLEVFLYLSEYF